MFPYTYAKKQLCKCLMSFYGDFVFCLKKNGQSKFKCEKIVHMRLE